MKTTRRVSFLLCCAALSVLPGCTTYVEQPAPQAVYVQPPPVTVETPQLVVTPPPVSVTSPPLDLPPSAPAAEIQIHSEDDFYQPLGAYGRWEVVGGRGRCWIPSRVERDWRPYCNGHWERTEAGWYWSSDEPWAWATYHYGRWDFSPDFGWYWVPETTWAPAWVSWHRGGGYLGWAPLSPAARVMPDAPVEVNATVVPPRAFVFVEEKRFMEPVRPTTVVVNNTTIINQTVNITNVKIVNNTVINEGPRTQVIEQASGRTVRPVAIHELRRRDEAAVTVSRNPTPPFANRSQPQFQPQSRAQNGLDYNRSQSLLLEQRKRELEQNARQASERHAKELERQAQLQAEQHARELQKQAQEDARLHAKELERKAQLEADQHARELRQKAQEEASKHARELEWRAQTESQFHARELEQRAREQAQQHTRQLQDKAQVELQRRAHELTVKAQAAQDRRNPTKPIPARQRSTNTVDNPQIR